MNDDRFEDALAEELAAYQEQLERGGPGQGAVMGPASIVSPSVETPEDLPSERQQELEEAKRCLDLLHALRRPRQSFEEPGYGYERAPEMRPAERFQRLDELGSGGFGVVWRARDPVTGRIVALKVPRPEVLASPELRKRFEQEAEAAARLDHPNIVPILEAGADGVVLYIASVYYEGPTLARWLAEYEGRVAPRLAALVALALAKALTHAHERGVLHRDVKPSNVLLAPADGGEDRELPFEPKLMDFGLAKLGESDQDLTRTGALLGTLKYMAPEQAAGRAKEITAATDVYGLGVVLYEMLAGAPPFSGESDWLTLRQVLENEPRSVSAIRRDVPRDLAVIVQKCLSKAPVGRYRSARELADDLTRYLEGKAIVARPAPPLELLGKWCRRNPAWAALVGVVALALVSCIAFLTYSNLRISRALASERATHEQLAMRVYAADMRLADEALKKNRVRHARDILQRHRPDGASLSSTDPREFAWRFMWGRLPNQQAFTPQHPAAVYSLDFSGDERLLATACADGKVRVWTTAGTLVNDFVCATAEPNEVAFSPDDRWLAAACDDGMVRVWETGTWTLRHELPIGGVVTTDFSGERDEIRALAVHENGSIVVVGTRMTTHGDAAVLRYKPNGTIDPSFNSDRNKYLWATPKHDYAQAVVVEPDGKIVVAGSKGRTDFTIARLNPDGSLDASFGEAGTVSIDSGTTVELALALVRQPDGKYVAAGMSRPAGWYDSTIHRLLPSGESDNSFGTRGGVQTEIGKFDDILTCLCLQPDGKIVAAGSVARKQQAPTLPDFAVVRYDADGALDSTFGEGGIVKLPLSEMDDVANAVAVQTDGKILVAGYGVFGTQYLAIVVRLNEDGGLDESFANGGIAKFNLSLKTSLARSVVAMPDGKILIGGVCGNGRDRSISIARLNADGSFDTTFGVDGLATIHVGNRSELHDMKLQQDGRLVVAGAAYCGGGTATRANFLLARLLPDGSLDRSFSSNGAQGVQFTPNGQQVISYAEQSVLFWDLQSGEMVHQVQVPVGSLKSVALTTDGDRMGTLSAVSPGSEFDIWDTKQLDAPLRRKGASDAYASLAFLPRENQVAISYATGQVIVYDYAKLEAVQDLELRAARHRRVARTSDDGQWLMTIGGNTVALYKTSDMRNVAEIVASGRVFDAKVGPNAESIITGMGDGAVLEWQLASSKSVAFGDAGRVLNTGPAVVSCMALSADDTVLACGYLDGMVRLIDTSTGEVRHEIAGQGSAVRGIRYLTSDQVVVGFANGKVCVLDVARRTLAEVYSTGRPMQRLTVSDDGRRLGISHDELQVVEVLAVPGFKQLCQVAHHGQGRRMAFSGSGQEIVVVGGPALEVFDTSAGKLISHETQHGNNYDFVRAFPDGKRMVVAEAANGLTVREISTCRVLSRMLGDAGGMNCVAVTPDGRNLASIGDDRILRIWDTATYESLIALDSNLDLSRESVMVFSSDGHQLYASGGATILVWDAN